MSEPRNRIDVQQLQKNIEYFDLRRRAQLISGKSMSLFERWRMYDIIRQRCNDESCRGETTVTMDTTTVYNEDYCMLPDSELTKWLIADGLEVAVQGRMYVISWAPNQEVKDENEQSSSNTN